MAKARGKIPKKLDSETKLQEAIQDWLRVTYEFNEWRHQLSEVMTACNASATGELYASDQRAIITLRILYKELIEDMKKLLSDANGMDERRELTLEQLVKHTNTIRQWSKKIKHVLSVHTPGAA